MDRSAPCRAPRSHDPCAAATTPGLLAPPQLCARPMRRSTRPCSPRASATALALCAPSQPVPQPVRRRNRSRTLCAATAGSAASTPSQTVPHPVRRRNRFRSQCDCVTAPVPCAPSQPVRHRSCPRHRPRARMVFAVDHRGCPRAPTSDNRAPATVGVQMVVSLRVRRFPWATARQRLRPSVPVIRRVPRCALCRRNTCACPRSPRRVIGPSSVGLCQPPESPLPVRSPSLSGAPASAVPVVRHGHPNRQCTCRCTVAVSSASEKGLGRKTELGNSPSPGENTSSA